MAALVTHLMVGLLVGLALRVRVRYLPWCMVAAGFMDLDNIFFATGAPDPWWLVRRGTLQNYFVSLLIPTALGVWAFLDDRFAPGVKRLAASLPAITGSHLLWDSIKAVPPYNWINGWTLFYPFSRTRWGIDVTTLATWDVRYFDGIALLLVLLVPLILAALILITGIDRDEAPELTWVRVGSYAVVFLVLLPLLVVGLGSPV